MPKGVWFLFAGMHQVIIYYSFLISFLRQDSQVTVRTLKFLSGLSSLLVRTLKFASGLPHQDDSAEGAHGSKGGLGVYHSLLGGRGRRVAVKEGGSLVGGTCEHCEDRAPSGLRQDSIRTLSRLCQDSVSAVDAPRSSVGKVSCPSGQRTQVRTPVAEWSGKSNCGRMVREVKITGGIRHHRYAHRRPKCQEGRH